MPFDAKLAARVRVVLGEMPGLVEKQMFGGVGFLLRGNMAVGVHGANLIVRVPADETAAMLKQPHTHPFDITGRPMRGWLLVQPEGLKTKAALARWVQRSLDFALTLPPKT